jgi:hypothetical protein
MNKKLFATSLAALGLAMASPAFAQNFTINEVPVPEDQVARIQAHCDTVLGTDASGAMSTESTSGDASASTGNDASASTGNDASPTTPEGAAPADATASTDTSATESTETGAEAGDGVGSSPVGNIDFTTLDLATIDAEDCRLGGFAAGAGADGAASGETTTTSN